MRERLFDPHFELANPGEILVDLAAVGRPELPLEPRGIVADEIEYAFAEIVAAGSVPWGSISPVPNIRSKTSFGLISLAIGVLGVFHEMHEEYAQL